MHLFLAYENHDHESMCIVSGARRCEVKKSAQRRIILNGAGHTSKSGANLFMETRRHEKEDYVQLTL